MITKSQHIPHSYTLRTMYYVLYKYIAQNAKTRQMFDMNALSFIRAIFLVNMLYISWCFICVSASRIRYEITSGNIGGAFAVKNMTGAIYVAGALDYETRKRVSYIRFYFPISSIITGHGVQ